MRGGQRIWIGKPNDGLAAVPGNGIMPDFLCESQAAVDAAHAAALAHGGTNEGNPGPRPLYGPDFYGAYARDPERSEEHTSELQSLMRISYAVFCLKKKNNY